MSEEQEKKLDQLLKLLEKPVSIKPIVGQPSGSSLSVYCGNIDHCPGNYNKVVLFYIYYYGIGDKSTLYCRQCGVKLDLTDMDKEVEKLKLAQAQTTENEKDKQIRELKEKLAETEITAKVEKRVEKKIKKKAEKADIWKDTIDAKK